MTRNKSVKLRLTEEEYRQLKRLAGKRGISAFIRIRSLGADAPQENRERLLLLGELGRIRNILSQIARNSKEKPLREQVELVTALVGVERKLSHFFNLMIIGFSSYGRGGSGPALDYLTGYLVNGETRATKPQVLRGSPKAVGEIIDALPFQCKYSSGVLSFASEDHVTAEIEEEIMDRFENTVFAGLPHDRRSIVWIKHTDKSRTELHFVVPRVDLGTGRALNIAPPTPASRHLLDTLRESINRRYGLRDPSDAECAQSVSRPAHIAKLASKANRLGQSPKKDIREIIAEQIEDQARKGLIGDRSDVIRFLKEKGFSITRESVNYLTIELPDKGERVRLKGNVFREHFSPRDLEPVAARRDPAQLFMLDQRLERLVEKRAAYHRARYGINEETEAKLNRNEELAHDRTRNPAAHTCRTIGNLSSEPRTAIWPDALRFNDAAKHFISTSHSIERAGERLSQADRTFARDFEQTIINVNSDNRPDALVRAYGLPPTGPSQEAGIEMELEL